MFCSFHGLFVMTETSIADFVQKKKKPQKRLSIGAVTSKPQHPLVLSREQDSAYNPRSEDQRSQRHLLMYVGA